MRSTITRIAILQVIKAAGTSCIGIEEIYRQLLQHGTPVSVGSIYRIVRQFESREVLLREWDRCRKTMYRLRPAGFGSGQLRMVCPDTGRVAELDDPELYRLVVAAAKRLSIDLGGRSLAIQLAQPAQEARDHAKGPRLVASRA
nr:transcriptional repressor [Stenotrophomonas maltophilia]